MEVKAHVQKQGSKNLLNMMVQSTHHMNCGLQFIKLFYFKDSVFCALLNDIRK